MDSTTSAPKGAEAMIPVMLLLEATLEPRGIVIVARTAEGFEACDDIDGERPPSAGQVVETISTAWIATVGASPDRQAAQAHVEQLAAGILASAERSGGPVWVSRTAWLLLRSYALTGGVPARADA